jgi:predicted RNA methylase
MLRGRDTRIRGRRMFSGCGTGMVALSLVEKGSATVIRTVAVDGGSVEAGDGDLEEELDNTAASVEE